MTAPLEDTEPLASADPRDRSLVSDARNLADAARAFAQAELAYQKARAAYAAGEARSLAILGLLAAALAFFALMALVFGLVLGLSTLVGPWIATAIVVIVLLVGAFALLLSVKSRNARMMTNLADAPEKPA